jgi:hypothetical protein
MNQDQIDSAVRTILKIVGTYLATKGLTEQAALINGSDVAGLITLLVGLWLSHQQHQSALPSNSPALPVSGPSLTPGAGELTKEKETK